MNASKGSYDKVGWTFAYDYFDANNPISPLAKLFVDEFKKEYGEDPDFYAANFYENTFVMWEVIRRVLQERRRHQRRRRPRRGAAGRT